MPKLLQEMIASIVSSEPRFRIVGRLGAESDLLSAIRQTGAQVLITQETKEPNSLNSNQNDRTQSVVNVLAINETGREAVLYRLSLHRTPLNKISTGNLISAIDRVAGSL
jgi:hypothetical protein